MKHNTLILGRSEIVEIKINSHNEIDIKTTKPGSLVEPIKVKTVTDNQKESLLSQIKSDSDFIVIEYFED